MYTVLVAVDAERETARLAAETVTNYPCAAEKVEATLLNVQKEFRTPDEGAEVSSEEFYDEDEFPASVSVAQEILTEAGVSTTRRREHGAPAERIVAVADELDADDIVIANEKRSPAGKALFGSVTQSVLLDTDRPVTVVSRDR